MQSKGKISWKDWQRLTLSMIAEYHEKSYAEMDKELENNCNESTVSFHWDYSNYEDWYNRTQTKLGKALS